VKTALSLFDWAVIAAYFLAVMFVGLYAAGKQTTTRDYFLGDRQIPWWAAALSIIATETSAVTFIGFPAEAYRGDWGFLQLAIGFVAGRVFLALFFIHVFYHFDVVTVYGYLERRFGNATRVVAALLFLAGRVIGSGVRLFAACLAVKIASGLPIAWAIAGLGLFGVGYTLVGGIRSVVWTDCILGLTFILGGAAAAGFIVAGIDGGPAAIVSHPALLEKFRVFHLGLDAAPGGGPATWSDFFASPRPLLIGLAGGFVLTLATHGTDQDLVQRMLTCRDARGGASSLVASAAVFFPMACLFLLIGTLLWFLHDQHPELRPALGQADYYFPDFIVRQVPRGVAGILFAGVFAAALSSLTSVLNALSSTAIEDFYRPFLRPRQDERHYVLASRVATVLWGVALVGTALAFLGSSQGVLDLALSVLTYFYGAILGAFLLGIFTRRGSALSTALGMLVSVPCVLLLQARAFLDAPEKAPDAVRSWLEALPAAWAAAVKAWVPLLGWPLWIIAGTAVSVAIGALGRQTIARRG
jgi:SSS family transporter